MSTTSESDTHDHEGLVWCFQCGNEYDEDVAECVECGVPTTSERPTDVDQVGEPEDDQIAYEFHEWTGQGRSTLDGMLTSADIDHAWQGATLIVREHDEEEVDAMVAQAEIVAMPTLDLSQPTMVYELDELDDEQHARLLRRLGDDGLNHAFDKNGDLFVYEKDEAAVDAVFGTLDEVDAEEREFGPGVDGADPVAVMSDLFVASGRLRKNPADPKGKVELVENAATADQMTLPYGLGADVWGAVVDLSAELSDALVGGDSALPDADIEELAAELNDLMRRLV